MSDTTENYWESIKVDPANYCPERGDYPHTACDVALHEGGRAVSHLYGVCHSHRVYWHLQSGGCPWQDLPSLEALEAFERADLDSNGEAA